MTFLKHDVFNPEVKVEKITDPAWIIANSPSAKVQNITDNFSQAVDYIHSNYFTPISIETLCSIACVSKAVLFRRFKTTFGLTPVEFILKKKVDVAKELLDDEFHYSIKHISLKCGFNNKSYFNHIFKRHVGMTPVSYRKRGN